MGSSGGEGKEENDGEIGRGRLFVQKERWKSKEKGLGMVMIMILSDFK